MYAYACRIITDITHTLPVTTLLNISPHYHTPLISVTHLGQVQNVVMHFGRIHVHLYSWNALPYSDCASLQTKTCPAEKKLKKKTLKPLHHRQTRTTKTTTTVTFWNVRGAVRLRNPHPLPTSRQTYIISMLNMFVYTMEKFNAKQHHHRQQQQPTISCSSENMNSIQFS